MSNIFYLKNTQETFLIGSNIKKWRAVKEIKQDYLAHKLNVTSAQLSKIENGKVTLTQEKVIEIAKALEVESTQLTNHNVEFVNIINSPNANSYNNNGNGNYNLKAATLSEKLLTVLEKLLAKIK